MSDEIILVADEGSVGRLALAFPDSKRLGGDLMPQMARLTPSATVWLSSSVPSWRKLLESAIQRDARLAVVVVSIAPSPAEGLSAFELGARGYCHAYATPEMLREVALVVRHGGVWLGPELLGRMIGSVRKTLTEANVDAGALASLSEREADVARAVAEGCTNKEVALRLGITERTVKAHLSAVFEKLGVRDRLQLALRLQG